MGRVGEARRAGGLDALVLQSIGSLWLDNIAPEAITSSSMALGLEIFH